LGRYRIDRVPGTQAEVIARTKLKHRNGEEANLKNRRKAKIQLTRSAPPLTNPENSRKRNGDEVFVISLT
jgi:hypothetical protein